MWNPYSAGPFFPSFTPKASSKLPSGAASPAGVPLDSALEGSAGPWELGLGSYPHSAANSLCNQLLRRGFQTQCSYLRPMACGKRTHKVVGEEKLQSPTTS